MRAVLYALTVCLALLALSMVLPLAFAVTLGEPKAVNAFLFTGVGLGFITGGLIMALKGGEAINTRWQRLILLAGIWLLVPLGASIPFLLTDKTLVFTSALFEAVSGFTTTGATVFRDIDAVPASLLVWRAELQWLGGFATFMSVAFLAGFITGPDAKGREFRLISDRVEITWTSVGHAVRTIAPIYVTLTFVCLIALHLSGIPAFDSMCLAFSAISTGGFMPRAGSLSLYGSPAAELILAFFMFCGAINLFWVRAMLRLEWRSLRMTNEPLFIGAAIFVLGFSIAMVTLQLSGLSDVYSVFRSLTIGIATAASYITTSGFFIDKQTHQLLPYILVIFLCAVGGGGFSTAGGLKVFRLTDMLSQSKDELNRLVYPHGVNIVHQAGPGSYEGLTTSIRANFIVFIMFIWIFAVWLAFFEFPFQGAFLASVSALSNIGPAYEFVVSGGNLKSPTYLDMVPEAKLLLSGAMILGRLEILVLLGLFNFAYWRS